VGRRGAGGLVTALTGALEASGGLWVAAAMTELDREHAGDGRRRAGPGSSYDVRYLVADPRSYDRAYNGISNRVLWFVHHQLWDVPRQPRFDRETETAWRAYREVNELFAGVLTEEGGRFADEGGPAYLVQDYHLALVPAILRTRLAASGLPPRISFFSHIPFAGPSYLRILPSWMREELLAGLLGADVVGFHARRWAENFLLCCRDLGGARVDLGRSIVRWTGREVRVRVYPISVDLQDLETFAATPQATRATRRLDRRIGESALILRVDRVELSKNILRGFLAYERFLEANRRWRGRVRFLSFLNPSREGVPEYRTYLRECTAAAERINGRFGREGWQPMELAIRDDFRSSVAAYGRYDVLLVNPVFDGMNLVAKEGPVLNRRDGVLILSENAGAFEELGRFALAVNPFDLEATARALAGALEMPALERTRRADGLRRAVRANPLAGWVQAQLDDLERVPAG
jgi:trehalose 6-phosphate synthase